MEKNEKKKGGLEIDTKTHQSAYNKNQKKENKLIVS